MSAVAVVTGASGCFGRALVARLATYGVDVRALSRSGAAPSGVRGVAADIRDGTALRAAFDGVDVVFHLAAYAHDLSSTDDTTPQQEITLGGTRAALTAAERAGVRHFIFASSLAVFGHAPDGATENAPAAPRTPYGRAKLAAEEAVREYADRTGAFAACLRPAMIYGAGCRGNLPRMISAVSSGMFPPIPEFGNRRSLVSADDAAEALRLAWKSEIRGGRAFIITDGRAYSTRQMYELILDALGKRPPSVTVPEFIFRAAAKLGDLGAAALGRRLPFDTAALERIAGSAYFVSDRARAELGYVPSSTLGDVLPSMIRHLSRIRHERH